MGKRKLAVKILSLLVCLTLVISYFPTLAFAENAELKTAKEELYHIAQEKIDIEVKKDLEKDEFAEVLVYMKDQLDAENVAQATKTALLSSMTPYQTKLQIRRAVVEALKDKADITQRNIIKYLEQEKEKGNVAEFKSYHIVNMLYVKATKEVIENLSFMAEVEKIYKNKTYTLSFPERDKEIAPSSNGLEWNIARIGADQVWQLGIDGTGAVVANLDSGVDWSHPALKEKWRGYDPTTGTTNPTGNWFDPIYNTTLPSDPDGHGTHVMGTMVGQEPDGSNKIGVAPGAKWIAARVFNAAGSTTDRILLDAAEWMLAPGGNPDNAPDVVNNSWGGLDGIDDWYRDAVRSWRAAGIFPVFSAGNQRPGEPAPWPGSIVNPANYPESFAVAAVDKNDRRASFSKLGPSPYDETLIKPNISAPGVSIRSSVPGGYEGGWSGTSMSAPHVSGTVALLVSANASLTVDEIEAILSETAEPLTDETYPESPNFGYGYGMVNAFEAVSKVATGIGNISGRVLVEGEDTQEPVIEHQQEVFETYIGVDIDIVANIYDDVSVTEVELLVKPEGKSYWMLVPMNRISGDHKYGTYKGTITADMLLGDRIYYKIKVRDFAGEVVVTPDYKIDVLFGIVPDEYTQGFETSAHGWIMTGSWQWGVPTDVGPSPYEGEGVVATNLSGEYPNNANDWLITPPIDLRDTSLETASLRFYEWYDMENNYDKGYVLITNDFGENWTEVRPAITGSGTQWREAIVNLEDYIGSENPVHVAFRFTSDFSVQRAGWYIDNVRLVSKDNDAPQPPSGLRAEATLAGIKLTWTHSPDPDVKYYRIFRSETSGEGYVEIAQTAANVYIDRDIVGGTTYYYVISAVDTSGNESEYSREIAATSLEAITIFGTDFEEDDGGFVTGVTAGTANPWEWGVPTSGPNSAFSGEKLWATNLSGNYDNRTDAYIETPPIFIPEGKDAILSFNHWVDMEGTTTLWDYGQVLISKDDGETWTNITPTPEGKYGRRAQAWASEEIFLSGYSGETIKIRFFFHSDTSGTYSGWYIDDVYVMGIDHVEPEPIEGEEIAYDDGTAEDALVLIYAGNGLAVRFTPSQYGKVRAANIYLWGNDWPVPGGNRLGFVIYDSNGNQVGTPIYVNNLVRGAWNLIDLSAFNFYTDQDFYISTMQDLDGDYVPAVGLDYNAASEWTRSYLNIGEELIPLSEADIYDTLMIRAIVDYTVGEGTGRQVSKPGISLRRAKASAGKDIIELRSGKIDVIDETKKANYVDPPAHDFKLRKNDNSLNNYKMISDEEVQIMPMIFTGIPVDDAVVTVLETGRSVKVNPVDGKFSMKHPVGEYTLRAEAYGYYSQDVVVNVLEDQTTRVNFVLQEKPKGTIIGRVIDRYYETPAAYATIRLLEDPRIEPVVADENGYFTIPNVLEGVYTLKVVAEGFESGEQTVEVLGNTVTEVEIRLKRFVGFEDEIIYDDGTAENALVLNSAGYGLAVRFTPEQYGKVKGASIYFWDSSWPTPGGNRIGFTIYETDENGRPRKVGEPIFVNIVRGQWNYIDLSSFGFSTDRDFYISTIQDVEGNYSPGTGVDEDSPYGNRSYLNIDGEFIPIIDEEVEGALMIRARMEYLVDVPTITNLKEVNYTNQDVITVEGTVTVNGKVNVYVNDNKIAEIETENKKFSIEVELPEERNIIKVTAEVNGVETEPSVVIVIKDKLAPELTVESPVDNAKLNVEVVHVKGKATDNIELAKLEINGLEVTVDEEGNFHERILVNQGENLITVRAVDHAGNETVVERRVFVQLEAPEITNIKPDEDLTLRAGDILEVSFNAPSGGEGYFRILMPFGLNDNEIGIPMVEEDGLYTGTWVVPANMIAENLRVEVVYVSPYGHTVSAMAKGRINIVADEDGNDSEPATIENLLPNEDVQLRAGETIEISFNSVPGGTAFYRLVLPFEQLSNRIGTMMEEVTPGFYKATYSAHDGVIASNLLVEIIFITPDGRTITAIADGRVTIVGNIADLPENTVIIGDEAFDMNYLERDPYAQAKLIEWINQGNEVYIKLGADTIVNMQRQIVSIDVLPDVIEYIDSTGVKIYAK